MAISKHKGFLVIEVLIAASIITGAVLASMAVSQKSVYVSRQSLHTLQAAFLLEEGGEAVRILRDTDWANISSLSLDIPYYLEFAEGNWSLVNTPATIDGFTRTVTMGSVSRDSVTYDISGAGTVDPEARLVTVRVSWDEGGTAISKNLQFYIMNIFQ